MDDSAGGEYDRLVGDRIEPGYAATGRTGYAPERYPAPEWTGPAGSGSWRPDDGPEPGFDGPPTNPIGWPAVPSGPPEPAGYPAPDRPDPWPARDGAGRAPGATDRPPAPDQRTTSAEPDPEPPAGRRGPGRRRANRRSAPDRPSRAGRNLPAAIAVGIALGAAVLVPLFLYLPAFLAVLVVAVGIGTWEMVRAVRAVDARPPLPPLMAGGVLMVALAWFSGPDALSFGLLATLLAAVVWRLADGPAGYQRDATTAALIAVYVPFLAGFAALLATAPGDGPQRVLVTLAAVVLSDTGGYAAGVSLGRHPMAPTVSPKKSWEGFAGSVLSAGIGSAVLLAVLFDIDFWWGAVFGIAVSVAAVLGDLGESMIKRDLGIKDMSNLLPGHGGLMDRLDSILFAVPTAYLLLALFAPVRG